MRGVGWPPSGRELAVLSFSAKIQSSMSSCFYYSACFLLITSRWWCYRYRISMDVSAALDGGRV